MTPWFFRLPAALAVCAACLSAPAAAQMAKPAPKTVPFLKTEVFPVEGTYLVLQDANVRQQPATKGRRIGRRAKGERVRVVGRAKGPWLAIRGDDGKDIGFIFRSTLMPVVDGSLDSPLSGKLTAPASKPCSYLIHFEGKSPAEGQAFEFCDYEIHWTCDLGGRRVSFRTPMFLTEGPYRGKTKRIHQITIDILDLSDSLEDVLSTHTLWNRTRDEITFDSITVKQFGRKPGQARADAKTLDQALRGAVGIAASAWNDPLWAALAQRTGGTGRN